MATRKKTDDIKAEEEMVAEIAEVQEEAPEVDLTADVAAAAEDENLAKPGAKEAKGEQVEDDEAETAESTDETDNEPKATAKAGRRSAKAVREAEAEEARQEAKEHRAERDAEEAAAPKVRRQQPNPLHQHGKKYREAAKTIERGKAYPLAEALTLAKNSATTKFDSTVELHINLGVDPRQADQMVRSSVTLPHGTGKTVRVAVYADGKDAEAAKTAGADLVGTAKLLEDIEKGKLDFDLLIAPPAGMATLGKVAKVLGPRGLMPNPKSGTVTTDLAKAVTDAKAGKVEFRIDKFAIVHQAIGKVSFKPEQLEQNAGALISAILKAKPSAAKDTYVKAMATTTSMGPSVKIDAAATVSAIATGKK